jgi:hypothetical protein
LGNSGPEVGPVSVSDDNMLTRDLEAEVREPAWSAKVCLGPQELPGAPGRDVPWPLSAHWCTWGSQVVCLRIVNRA